MRNVEYKGLSTIQVSDILKALSEKKATLSQGRLTTRRGFRRRG